MNKKTVLFLLIFCSFSIEIFASDTTHRKKPFFILLSAGYASNTVYGSMVDHNHKYDDIVNMKNKAGFLINVNAIKPLSGIAINP